MAFEKLDRVPPHVAIRQEIAKHRRSMMVAASGLAPVLEMLDAYIVATEARLDALDKNSHAPIAQTDIYDRIEKLEVRANGKAT